MHLTSAKAHSYFEDHKSLVLPLEWRVLENRNANLKFEAQANVQMNGAVVQGLIFRATASSGHNNRLTFQLEYKAKPNEGNIILYRLELSPSGAHTNGFVGPVELQGLSFEAGETHEHQFQDSLKADGSMRKRTDKIARKIPDPPIGFAEALGYLSKKLNISNTDSLPNPPTQGGLI